MEKDLWSKLKVGLRVEVGPEQGASAEDIQALYAIAQQIAALGGQRLVSEAGARLSREFRGLVEEANAPRHGAFIQRGRARFCGQCGRHVPSNIEGEVCEDQTSDPVELRDRIEWRISCLTEERNSAMMRARWRDRRDRVEARAAAEGRRQHVSETIRGLVGGWNRRP